MPSSSRWSDMLLTSPQRGRQSLVPPVLHQSASPPRLPVQRQVVPWDQGLASCFRIRTSKPASPNWERAPKDDQKLKQLIGDLSLEKVMLQDVLSKISQAHAAKDARGQPGRSLSRRNSLGLYLHQLKPTGVIQPASGQWGCATALADRGDRCRASTL